ncbi:hypothetical protein GEMRC1_004633 [Eukaryota sp. GEM-RC1]
MCPEYDDKEIKFRSKAVRLPASGQETLSLKPELRIGESIETINHQQLDFIRKTCPGSKVNPIAREMVPKTANSMECMIDLYPLSLKVKSPKAFLEKDLSISSAETVSTLKTKIGELCKIDPKSHEFNLSSDQDDIALGDIPVPNESTITVSITFGKGNVSTTTTSFSPSTLHGSSPSLNPRYPLRSSSNFLGTRTNPRGITGLSNIGNTCFMNSIIQSISHCVDLTEFVLSEDFKKDLNKDNPIGAKGKIALAWRETVHNLWNGKASVYTPTKLKHEVGMMASQFLGYRQHDSQEFLSFLLDYLHEDLNRVRNKPYFDTDIDSDQEEVSIAEESIQRFNARNQSRVSELFTSLYRSKLKCPTCKKDCSYF